MVAGFACAAGSSRSWHACDVSVSGIHSTLGPARERCGQATLGSESSGQATLWQYWQQSGDFVQ